MQSIRRMKSEVVEELKARLEPLPAPVPGLMHYIGHDLSAYHERAALCLLTVNSRKKCQEARFILYCKQGHEICLELGDERLGESQGLSSEDAEKKGFVHLFKQADLSRTVAGHVLKWRKEFDNRAIIVYDSLDMPSICDKLGQEHVAFTVQVPNTPVLLARAMRSFVHWMNYKKIKIEDNPIALQHFKNTCFKKTSQGEVPCASTRKADHKNQAFMAFIRAIAGWKECSRKKLGTKLNPIDNDPNEGEEPLKAEDLFIFFPDK